MTMGPIRYNIPTRSLILQTGWKLEYCLTIIVTFEEAINLLKTLVIVRHASFKVLRPLISNDLNAH